jgi:hypothetical protein
MASPWPVLMPIILIALLTIGMNLLTDALARAIHGRGRRQDAPPLDEVLGVTEREAVFSRAIT